MAKQRANRERGSSSADIQPKQPPGAEQGYGSLTFRAVYETKPLNLGVHTAIFGGNGTEALGSGFRKRDQHAIHRFKEFKPFQRKARVFDYWCGTAGLEPHVPGS